MSVSLKMRVLIVLLLLAGSAVRAQQRVYSLTQLVAQAENHLPVLLQKQAIVRAEQANLKAVRHSFLPTMAIGDEINIGTDNSLAGGYLPQILVPSVSAGVADANNMTAATGNMASFYSQYNLVNFGLHKAELTNAASYMELGKADYDKEFYLAKLEICQLYLDLLRNEYRLNVDSQNIRRYQHIFNIIRSLALSGIKAGADSAQAGAELSSSKVSYNQTLGKIYQLKNQLAYFTGIVPEQLQVDTIHNKYSGADNLPYSIPDSLNNPVINYYAKQRDVFLTTEKLISRSYLPRIVLGVSGFARGSSIQYSQDYKDLSTGLGYQRFNYIAGIGVTYDLFNGIYKRDKLAINHYQLLASDYALQQQKLALQTASSSADAALRIAEANLRELPNQTKAATDVYEQKTAQYRAGLITLIDLTNASFVLYRSQTDYIEAVNEWYNARLYKAEATGNLDLFIQSLK